MKYTFEIDLDRYKNLAQQKQKTHKKFSWTCQKTTKAIRYNR